tara:strand:+ start:217 stop:660 length:444 start_codon:yes stop_codon:yes gene_type:complete
MAGQTPLLIEASGRNHSVPDHFQDIVVQLSTKADTPADVDDSVLFYAERDTVVDSAFIVTTKEDADQTFQLKRITVVSGSAQDPDSAGTALSNAQVLAAAYTPYTFTLVETENLIPAGSMVAINIEGTGSAEMEVTVQMRIRTRVTG